MKPNVLTLSWGTSRGQSTYGYTICRLDDGLTHKRYACNGGGYDMVGTVFADWLEETQQEALQALASTLSREEIGKRFYGMHQRDDGTVYLQGMCGIGSMLTIATEGLGLTVQRFLDKAGHTQHFLVMQPEGAEAL